MKLRSVLVAALLVMSLGATSFAEVRVPHIFSDNMVLQRDQEVKVWGWADPGEAVEVSFGGQTLKATADDKGEWQVSLQPMPANKTDQAMSIKSKANAVTLSNVLVGDVWLCSGQSNMFYMMSQSEGYSEEQPTADHPQIRFFKSLAAARSEPQSDLLRPVDWCVCTPANLRTFSAVAYYFALRLHKEIDVPIGLIRAAVGGTRCEAWTPWPAVANSDSLKPLADYWLTKDKTYDPEEDEKQLVVAIEEWKKRVEAAKAAGKQPPHKPKLKGEPKLSRDRVAGLYNAMIHPLTPFSIRGFIWYQGESNVPRAYQHRELFPRMIESWRTAWGQKDLPFYYVQLASFNYGSINGDWIQTALPEMWESQLMTLSRLKSVGMAVTTDISTVDNVHPTKKREVGERLALWALAKHYGKADIVCSGPLYKSAEFKDGEAILSFDYGVDLKSSDGKDLTHFQSAGEDKVFHDASARIVDDKIVVSSKGVEKPIAVRFAWRQDAMPNLVNGAGLPASPFRTDSFPAGTESRVVPD